MSFSTHWIPAACLAFAASACAAQYPCDSLHTAGFTYQDNGGYGMAFTPDATLAGAQVLYAEWGFAGVDLMDYSGELQPQYVFPAPAPYLVCLNATVVDDQQNYCQSTSCQLVTVPEDSLCAPLQAAYTINVQGGAIYFIDQSQSGAPIYSWMWQFGDGSSSTEASPLHSYAGPGPYQACLTVSTATCSATACNWIYLGSPDVPCDTLLHVDFAVVQLGHNIAVFDQSISSGMNASVAWDFGDGSTASGSPIVHTFAYDGYFEVCATISLWGPLTPDTCTATACTYVSTYAATGIAVQERSAALRAWPVPFTESCTVEGVAAPCRWELTDALGRIQRSGSLDHGSLLVFSGDGLGTGTFLLRIIKPKGVDVLRVVKAGG